MAGDCLAVAHHLHLLERRIEVGGRLEVGAHAVGRDLGLQGSHRVGEPSDAVVGLGQEVLPPGALAIALAIEAVALLLVLSAELAPNRDPDVIGGPGELVHSRSQLVEVVDHRHPAAVETAVLDDERILAGGEGEVALFNRHNCSWGGCANVSAQALMRNLATEMMLDPG